MKRIIACYIALCILAYGIIPTSANNTNTISKAEAQKLVAKACDFHRDVHVCTQFDETPIYNTSEREIVYIYDENSKEVVAKSEVLEFFRVYEDNLPGGSYEAMCKYAETLYTEDIASSSYMFLPDVNSSYKHYCEDDGYLYFKDINEDLFVYPTLDHSIAFLNEEYYKNRDYTKISIDIIAGDSTSAIAEVDVHNAWGWSDKVTCKFINTSNGWRIAESEYSILLAIGQGAMNEYRALVSPSTADTAFASIALLPVMSIASLVSAAFLICRRRRTTIAIR